ncbi:MAG: DUF4091 domain-containing protein [Bacillota bacterium]|nr:DUF4091 domain-containing protein [Bacillota bacterium]
MQIRIAHANDWLYPDSPFPATPSPAIEILAARGSYAAVQVLVRGSGPFSWLLEGNAELADALEVFRLRDVPVRRNSAAAPWVTRPAPFRVYEVLEPLPERRTESSTPVTAFYLRWAIPADCEPGLYSCRLRLQAGTAEERLPLCIEVSAAVVPATRSIAVTNWFNLNLMASYHDLEPWSEAHWAMIESYARLMHEARQTHFWIPFSLVGIGGSPEAPEFDFSRVERLIRLFLDIGLTGIEGGHIAGRVSWKNSVQHSLFANREIMATSHEGYRFLVHFLGAWRRFLEEHGWYDLLIQHIADEPIERSAADYRILAGIVRKLLPGVPLIDAVMYEELAGALDIYVPTSKGFSDYRAYCEGIRTSGDQLWFYTCLHPTGPWLNRFIDTPLLNTRLLHWSHHVYGLEGYLHWGFNMFQNGEDAFEQTNPEHGEDRVLLPSGDSHIVYPGRGEAWRSLRLEAMRSGLEDCELLFEVAAHDRAEADRIAALVFRGFDDAEKDLAVFEAARRELLDAAASRQTINLTP